MPRNAQFDGIAYAPEAAARAETEQWLAGHGLPGAVRELLAEARGSDERGPLRRLYCQQALALTGPEAEPALGEVLDDAELGGLVRVWLAERGAAVVLAPPEAMVFWLAVDTIAAQLAVDGGMEGLQGLVEGWVGRHSGLVGQHGGFFGAAWRVERPAAADVLEAMGRLRPGKRVAKGVWKAAFKAWSRA